MSARPLLSLVGFTLLLISTGLACGGSTNDDGQPKILGTGTRPPDGAPGACCTPVLNPSETTVIPGGYAADGDCRILNGSLSDAHGLRLVDDAHGCKRAEYTATGLPPPKDSDAAAVDESLDAGIDAASDAKDE